MKIAIFFEHAFGPGGAPVGIRHFARSLSTENEVMLWGKHSRKDFSDLPGIQSRRYRNIVDLYRKVPLWIRAGRPDVLVVVGFFLLDNLSAVSIAKRHGITVVLQPLAQVWKICFEGKIFTQGCDVPALVQKGTVHSDGLFARTANWLSPYIKQVYRYTFGYLMVKKADQVAVMSEEEKRQFMGIYSSYPNHAFLRLPWGIDVTETNSGQQDQRHFYRDILKLENGLPNFVVWARLDWYYKGLSRLLQGVDTLNERLGSETVPFRLFLCGPDYREGSIMAAAFVKRRHLDDIVQILPMDSIDAGSKTPLRDADASILLSTWDGSPRALRESIFFGIPMLVSKETNFVDIICEHSCGIVVNNPDEPSEVADCLLTLADKQKRGQLQVGANNAGRNYHWDLVAKRFVEDLDYILRDGLTQ